jgi:hypothetical protein
MVVSLAVLPALVAMAMDDPVVCIVLIAHVPSVASDGIRVPMEG